MNLTSTVRTVMIRDNENWCFFLKSEASVRNLKKLSRITIKEFLIFIRTLKLDLNDV